jgi:hypothetical protein
MAHPRRRAAAARDRARARSGPGRHSGGARLAGRRARNGPPLGPAGGPGRPPACRGRHPAGRDRQAGRRRPCRAASRLGGGDGDGGRHLPFLVGVPRPAAVPCRAGMGKAARDCHRPGALARRGRPPARRGLPRAMAGAFASQARARAAAARPCLRRPGVVRGSHRPLAGNGRQPGRGLGRRAADARGLGAAAADLRPARRLGGFLRGARALGPGLADEPGRPPCRGRGAARQQRLPLAVPRGRHRGAHRPALPRPAHPRSRGLPTRLGRPPYRRAPRETPGLEPRALPARPLPAVAARHAPPGRLLPRPRSSHRRDGGPGHRRPAAGRGAGADLRDVLDRGLGSLPAAQGQIAGRARGSPRRSREGVAGPGGARRHSPDVDAASQLLAGARRGGAARREPHRRSRGGTRTGAARRP